MPNIAIKSKSIDGVAPVGPGSRQLAPMHISIRGSWHDPPSNGASSTPIGQALDPNELVVSDLRPFFGFYGGKWRDTPKLYPAPKYKTVVEPFAGSAGYAIRYAHLRVVLCERDPMLAAVWRYLLKVSEKEMLAIPNLRSDRTVDDLKISQEAKWLVGLWLNRGTATPRKSPSKWMRERIRPGSFWGPRVRATIASQLYAIRHWKVFNCSYEECPHLGEATWFIDPPYEGAGKHYRFGSKLLDFEQLAAWCRSRIGQVIVCENKGAKWLSFKDVASTKTTRAARRSKEVVWVGPQPGPRATLRTVT